MNRSILIVNRIVENDQQPRPRRLGALVDDIEVHSRRTSYNARRYNFDRRVRAQGISLMRCSPTLVIVVHTPGLVYLQRPTTRYVYTDADRENMSRDKSRRWCCARRSGRLPAVDRSRDRWIIDRGGCRCLQPAATIETRAWSEDALFIRNF